ncbi:ImmA/IrrE family metallo-endopeptidase [Rahnella sp. RcJ3]|uniref:ImmA/IrrE family metallo-endopeptidase n=1 Tax=Rahnella sp. RcJ3 TaxID=2292446 RepID=UPI00351A5FFB
MSGQDYRVPIQSRKNIRDLTRSLRSIAGIRSIHFPIMKFMEMVLPLSMPNFELHIEEVGRMPGTHGITYPGEHLIILREDVYEGAIAGNGRDRMTVAHELGHLLLHKNIAFARSQPELKIKPFESSEWQAKCFAGELMVPATHAASLKIMSALELSEACGISVEAAGYQLKELNKI